jgi:hypothetical protein
LEGKPHMMAQPQRDLPNPSNSDLFHFAMRRSPLLTSLITSLFGICFALTSRPKSGKLGDSYFVKEDGLP